MVPYTPHPGISRNLHLKSSFGQRWMIVSCFILSQTYSLKRRAHDSFLHEHSTRLIDCNFIINLLYDEVSWLNNCIWLTIFYYCVVHFCIVLSLSAFCQLVRINRLLLLLFLCHSTSFPGLKISKCIGFAMHWIIIIRFWGLKAKEHGHSKTAYGQWN